MIKVERMFGKPIITQEMDESIGDNINGATLIKVPDWVENPLGKYYLYFAHHAGKFIRLAYNNELDDKWSIYTKGVLSLENSHFNGHIASPDIYINHAEKKFYMYYHGMSKGIPGQFSRVAVSDDGINFTALPEIIGKFYFRVFKKDDYFYAVTMRDGINRSRDGLTNWENIPFLYREQDVRHLAVYQESGNIKLFYTVKEQAPERIYMSNLVTTGDWTEWFIDEPVEVLRPETEYEGALEPLELSHNGPVYGTVNHLRDPYIYKENGQLYLLYSCAGEMSIAMAKLWL